MTEPNARPLVIAHRGASEHMPEHTLAAYVKAIDDGADGLEADVRLAADGHLVCVHDRRIDRTSNGEGVLSTLELADLESLDFGGWQQAAGAVEVPDQVSADHYFHVLAHAFVEVFLSMRTRGEDGEIALLGVRAHTKWSFARHRPPPAGVVPLLDTAEGFVESTRA